MISRRNFHTIAGGALLATKLTWAADEVPGMLDHIMLACADLDRGMAFVQEQTGVRAAYGGVHPGRGTRNALLSLGDMQYLEIIAPDPAQTNLEASAAKQIEGIKRFSSPRVLGWAARTIGIEGLAKKLQSSGVAFVGPWGGSRTRSDGKVLHWKTLALKDDLGGLLPFFIEWGADSMHPSKDAPSGCKLEQFGAAGPDVADIAKAFQRVGVDTPIEHAAKPRLRARITAGAKKLEISS